MLRLMPRALTTLFTTSSPALTATGATGQNTGGSGGVGTRPSGFGHPKCLNTGNQTLLPDVE